MPESVRDKLNDAFSAACEAAKEEGREEGLEKGLETGREEGLEKGREEGREEGIALAVNVLAPSDDASPIVSSGANETALTQSLAHQVCLGHSPMLGLDFSVRVRC